MRTAFEDLVSLIDIIPFSIAVARRCAGIREALKSQGRRVRGREFDLMNAATALEYGLTLVTRNSQDYADVPGLALLAPS